MTSELKSMIEMQINKEFYSAYLYFEMAEYYRSKGLDGFHKYFEKQAQEELEHGEKFAEFLHDREKSFKLLPIEAPCNDYQSFRDPLVLQVEHEKKVTEMIFALYKQAEKDGDILVKNFLTWYVTEQQEEEKRSKDLLDDYDLYAKDGGLGLYQINKDMGARV